MRSMFYPVLGLIVSVVLGVAWLTYQPTWITEVPAAIASFVQPPPRVAPKPSALQEVVKERPKKREQTLHVVSATAGFAAVEDPPQAQSETRRRFPLATGIRAGTARANLLASFGQPDAAIAGSDIGQFRERYVYIEHVGGRKTFISLVNGNVIYAETLVQ